MCFVFLFSSRYKCHKDCAPNAPPNCGLREVEIRRMIDNNDIQNALGMEKNFEFSLAYTILVILANSSPITRKYPYQSRFSIAISIEMSPFENFQCGMQPAQLHRLLYLLRVHLPHIYRLLVIISILTLVLVNRFIPVSIAIEYCDLDRVKRKRNTSHCIR